MPENLHFTLDAGINFNVATDLDNDAWSGKYNIDLPKGMTEEEWGNQTYSGPGIHFGSSLDYYLDEIPIAFKLFFNANVVPQTPPFTSSFTYFGNVGLSMVLILKRSTKNNTPQ